MWIWGDRKNEKGRNKEDKGHKPSRDNGYKIKVGGRRMFEKLPKVPISCQELPAALSSRCKLFQNNRKYIPEAFNSAKKHFQGHFKRGHSNTLHFTTIWRLFSGRNNILGIVDNRSLFCGFLYLSHRFPQLIEIRLNDSRLLTHIIHKAT